MFASLRRLNYGLLEPDTTYHMLVQENGLQENDRL